MSDKTADKLAAIAADAEAAEADQTDRPIPEHVTVSRPNRARSKVLQVRLNPDEFEAIERIAADRGLPPSTLARERLLAMIREDRGGEADVATVLVGVADQLRAVANRVNLNESRNVEPPSATRDTVRPAPVNSKSKPI